MSQRNALTEGEGGGEGGEARRIEASRESAATREPTPFTRFVEAWDLDREPEAGLAAEMWSAFTGTVRRELSRRSMDRSSPEWLGIYGFRGWWEVAGRGGPFEDLVAEAYRYVFVARFATLKALTRAQSKIEGLVVASVRHFLHDRHRLHDRLGARVFEVLSQAVRRAIELGDLKIVAGGPKLGNSTVLATGESSSSTDLARTETLEPIVRRWNDELLPDLVTASRLEKRQLVENLGLRLAELEFAGVTAFRFGDLIAPLKADVRARWAALMAPGEDGPPDQEDARGLHHIRHSLEPAIEDQVIAADRFAKLIDCVDRAIDGSRESGGTRGYLRRVLLFLRTFATEESEEDLPSFRRLAEHLKIPRDRLGQLISTLKGFLERCRRRLDGELVRVRSNPREPEEARS